MDGHPSPLLTCSDVTEADNAALIREARYDGDSLTRELAERLYREELVSDELRRQLQAMTARAAAAELALCNQTARAAAQHDDVDDAAYFVGSCL